MCDTMDYAVGALLGQHMDKKLHVIYCLSNLICNTTKLNTTEKELLAIVFYFRKVCAYLLGAKVIVFTYHVAIRYLTRKKTNRASCVGYYSSRSSIWKYEIRRAHRIRWPNNKG